MRGEVGVLSDACTQFDMGRWMSSPFMNVAKRELAYHKNQSYDGRRKSGMLRLTVHI